VTEPVYPVRWTRTASKLLDEIPDERIRDAIITRAGELKKTPDQQGKPLIGPLMGYRSVRAEGQRYRIIYQVRREAVIVVVVAVGLRKQGDARDVYALAQRLFRQGIIRSPKGPKRRK
jgi:mRNA interferase RelE/StbE